MEYIAHINDETKKIQTVKEHSENTARLCQEYAVPALKDVVYAAGLLHDLGKFQDSFQKRICGEAVKVEHSTCGAAAVRKLYPGPAGVMMGYCIAGHHSGIPDGGYKNDTGDKTTLYGRMSRGFEDYSAYQKELQIPEVNEKAFAEFLMRDCGGAKDRLFDKFSFFTRYCFSCLVDADSTDTADFCGNSVEAELFADFERCLEKVNRKLDSFICTTDLQRMRASLQRQVFEKSAVESEIYLMNMPTGSGKTLCSLKFALERALRKQKKRIIYVIPYNSIIDQTAEVFEKLLGEDADILRHQSTFSYEDQEDYNENYRLAAKSAMENWDAPLIITTAVQFFESLYSNRRGKLRKLHNMADCVLIFDEAHLMPQNYLKPCLEGISYIARYLNSEAVFLTATMPDFKNLIEECVFPDSRIVNLIDDTSMFPVFQKCRYCYLGKMSLEQIVQRAKEFPSSLIVVNKRRTARELFKTFNGRCYHLSTYMTAFDRKRVIDEIKRELYQMEQEYPDLQDVPEERRIVVVSTSLIEAGVDLDFFSVFRERSGLDSILQAGGRCNREGKRKCAEVFVFDQGDSTGKKWEDERANITKGLLAKYEDISCQECIQEYYKRLFFMKRDEIFSGSIGSMCSAIDSIPFKEYGDSFEIVDSKTVSVVAVRDEKSRDLMEQVRYTGTGMTRKLQKYTFSVYQYEFDELFRQHVLEDYGSGIWFLMNPDYYDEKLGVLFDAKDYFIE